MSDYVSEHLQLGINILLKDISEKRIFILLEAARARGRKGGRKPSLNKKQTQMMMEIYEARSTSISEICEQFKISRKTFYRYVEKSRNIN